MSQRLAGRVVPVAGLPAETVAALYRLFSRHYDCVDLERFQADLGEKTWVLLLEESGSRRVVGFSTMRLMRAQVAGQPADALFSGDTIIDREAWGSLELVRAWCRFVGSLTRQDPARRLYWLLISKGYRTYLFLPLYFREFYPRYDRPTPIWERSLIQALATARYPQDFNPATGVVEFAQSHGHLTPELARVAPHQLRNPHVRFFLERNPGHRRGHELVCLAELAPENMRRLAARALRDALEEPGIPDLAPLYA